MLHCVFLDCVISYVLPYYRYLNAIQTMCPHILRYLTTAVITNKDVRKRRQVLKDLVKVIQQVPDVFICVQSAQLAYHCWSSMHTLKYE